VYVLVAPFSTINDNMEWSDLVTYWRGERAGSIAGNPIWMDSSTLKALSALLGQPASGSIMIADSEDLINAVWENQPARGIVPFEDLEPRWKVISIDGHSPISNEFDLENYPLKIDFSFDENGIPSKLNFPESNRDPNKFTSLVMTGVTALVRATAGKMEKNGVLYPGKDIRNWLVSADLTHISNEIPFSDECPFPDPNQKTLVFCSDKKYIALLVDVGTDIVELTGNHFQDYGSAATYSTLEMYNLEGWIYFGGGANLEDARSPKIIIHNGNKLAFIGCNPAGPQYAWATNYQPGASPCDYGWMHAEISRLASEGYLPIVTFQYVESYSVHPLPDQVEDFRAMAAAGALIISGSQAHLPQTMEFINNSFIHYGLGNLFFDQMDYPVVGTRREFIDRHIFYDGKFIGTELLTALLEDYSRPRPMTIEERSTFLQDIFAASGW
jgi:poly-gamma-glutamate synthesis protein (capsule biosynthesis protein)